MAGRVSDDQVVVGVVEPGPAQVFGRRGIELAAEGRLYRVDDGECDRGDIGDVDVLVCVLADERWLLRLALKALIVTIRTQRRRIDGGYAECLTPAGPTISIARR